MGPHDSIYSGDYNSFLIITMSPEIVRDTLLSKDLDDEYAPLRVLFSRTLMGLDDDGNIVLVFKWEGDRVELRGEGVEITTSNIKPGLREARNTERGPSIISESSLRKFLELLMRRGYRLETPRPNRGEEPGDPVEVIHKTQAPSPQPIIIDGQDILIELRQASRKKARLIKALLDYMVNKNYYVTTDTWILYCWDDEEKIYVECDKRVLREIKTLGFMAEIEEYITRYIMREVLEGIKAFTYKSWKELESSKWYIVTGNGILLNMRTWGTQGVLEYMDPGPHVFTTTKINAPLDLDLARKYLTRYMRGEYSDWAELAGELCPSIDKAFNEWVGEDNKKILYEIIGYTLWPEYSIHRAFMLLGDGSNGKSTYLKLIEHFLGRKNVAHVSLQDLAENRFSAYQLVGKLANIFPDIPSRPLRYTGIFKALTGQDTIYIDVKHRHGFNYENYAKLIFSANELPRVNDMTYAFWRRWIIVEFPNKFPHTPGFLKQLLTPDEMKGLLIISLIALREVLKKGEFSVKADFREKWLRETNSVYAFIKDLLDGKVMHENHVLRAEEKNNGYVDTKTLYMIYVNYCRENDLDPVPKRSFTIEMERLGYRKVKIGSTTYYKGIEIVEGLI